jgi:NADPH2:quinone reductase
MTTTRAAVSRPSTVPTVMEAVAIDRFGPPSMLKIHSLPVPKPGPHEVLIALHAAGVGIWDAKTRDGAWATGDERFPLVLGADGAGTVVARGARVRRFKPDDRVWAYAYGNRKGGFYAEYVAVKAEQVGRVPQRLDLLEAGAAAVTGLTALQGIDRLRLDEGATVLIFGGTGAVGTLAIQFARARQARVLATASGQDGAALVTDLGAEAAIDARQDDAVERLRALAPDGLDAVLALAGGEALERCLALVRAGGGWPIPTASSPSRSLVRAFARSDTTRRSIRASSRSWSAPWRRPGSACPSRRSIPCPTRPRRMRGWRRATSWAGSCCRWTRETPGRRPRAGRRAARNDCGDVGRFSTRPRSAGRYASGAPAHRAPRRRSPRTR